MTWENAARKKRTRKNKARKNRTRKNENEKRWKLCRLDRSVRTGSAGFHHLLLFLNGSAPDAGNELLLELFLNGSAHDAGNELLLEYHEDDQDRQGCDGGG